MIYLFIPYTKRVANGVTVLWIFLIIIGIGSVYFHATLSFVSSTDFRNADRTIRHPRSVNWPTKSPFYGY